MRNIKQTAPDGKYIIFEGKKLLNFCSNDYLGICSDKTLRENFLTNYKESISLSSARLLSGTSPIYNSLEKLLAQKTKRERTLLFNSGYHANLSIYSTLADVVFCDKLNHASIIDGIKLGGAKLIPFKHLNYSDLREKLKKYRNQYKRAVISTESLFSMDGDFFNQEELIALKKEFNCILVVDEAHTFGVFDPIISKGDVDLIMGTFGKAIGSYGAFCAGNDNIIHYLINNARPFIFSTTFPQIAAAWSEFVLKNGDLASRAQKLRALAKSINAQSYIIPIILEDVQEKCDLLLEKGFYTLPIRYPTVPKNASRIRISLNSLIKSEEILQLLEILGKKASFL